jgi:hypothetical protein
MWVCRNWGGTGEVPPPLESAAPVWPIELHRYEARRPRDSPDRSEGHNALAMLVSRAGETLSGSEADGLRSYPYWQEMGTSA